MAGKGLASAESIDSDFESAEIQPAASGMGFIEYAAPNGEKWRIERGADLMQDFELENPGQLVKWHSGLSGQEPVWTIICRFYGNAKLLGVEDPDELRAWTIAELAEKRGVEPREIDSHLAGAKMYWKRWQLQSESKVSEPIRSRKAPDREEAERLLLEQGFAEIDRDDERSYAATRIIELSPWLESDHLRPAARSLIQQELSIFFVLDPTIRELRSEIRDKLAKHSGVEKESKQLLDLLDARAKAQSQVESSMKILGVADGQGNNLRKKMMFTDCLSGLVQAIQKYHSEGDTALIDTIFTAAEVELLTKPTSMRSSQYRPDLIVMAIDAREHLWEAEWSPTQLSRRACRKLCKAFGEGLAQARSDEGEVTADEIAEDEILDAAEPAQLAASPFEAPTNQAKVPSHRASTMEEPAAMLT